MILTLSPGDVEGIRAVLSQAQFRGSFARRMAVYVLSILGSCREGGQVDVVYWAGLWILGLLEEAPLKLAGVELARKIDSALGSSGAGAD